MDKLCAFFKKHDGLIAILVFAVVAVYAICMSTPAAVLRNAYETTEYYDWYSQFMPMNDAFIFLAIFGIVWGVLYSVLRNQIRKVYYISNIVWHCVYIAFCLGAGIYMIISIANYQNAYSQLPFDQLNAYYESHHATHRIDSNPPVFVLGYLVTVLVILSAVPVALVLAKQMKARFFTPKKVAVVENNDVETPAQEADEKGE